jgi:hypothetical protein
MLLFSWFRGNAALTFKRRLEGDVAPVADVYTLFTQIAQDIERYAGKPIVSISGFTGAAQTGWLFAPHHKQKRMI